MGLPSCFHLCRLYFGKWFITFDMRVTWNVYNEPGCTTLTTLCDWFKKPRAFHPTNQLQGNKPIATWSHAFPALFAGHGYFTRVFIANSLCALYLV